MKAIVHIGTEKTGSSTIQSFLDDTREELLLQGLYFMRCPGLKNDRKLVAYSLLNDNFDAYHKIYGNAKKAEFDTRFEAVFIKEFNSIPSSVHTVIFSSEHFHSRVTSDEEKYKLKNFLLRFFTELTFVVYLRQQVEVAISRYSTALKHNSTTDIEAHISACKAKNIYYNYHTLLDSWGRVFNESNLKVRLFDKKKLIGGSVLVDFCNIIDFDMPSDSYANVNASVSSTGQEIFKKINSKISRYAPYGGLNPINVAWKDIVSETFPGRGQQPSLEVALSIQADFADSNELVRRRFFPDCESLFDINYKKFEVSEEIDYSIVDVFDRLIDSFLAKNDVYITKIPNRDIRRFNNFTQKLVSSEDEILPELVNVARRLSPTLEI